ncbi:MAG: hypothetical protein K6A43_04665 [Treponema sp.]|nr:hypothetical protein [Treponema sp.]
MKKYFVILSFLFFIFSENCFSLQKWNGNAKTQIGTLYTDESGISLDYSANFGIQINSSKLNYFFNTNYTGVFSNIDTLNGNLNHCQISIGASYNKLECIGGIFFGKVPNELIIQLSDSIFSLIEISYYGGYSIFFIPFADNFSTEINFFAGNQKSKESDLFLLFGNITSPFFAGGLAKFYFPFDFILDAFYSRLNLAVSNKSNIEIGNGFANFIGTSLSKNLSFKKNSSHDININLGFLYAGGSGTLTESLEFQQFIFHPLSYLHIDGNADLFFITLKASYKMNSNKIQFLSDFFLLLNINSQLNCFYKATLKKNLIYDGSIQRYSDSRNFSNGDSFIGLNAKINYPTKVFNSLGIDFYAQKTFVIPLISQKTQNLFSQEQTDDTGDVTFNTAILKTIFLSGISLGAEIAF